MSNTKKKIIEQFLVFIDFWDRLTVYSLWFILCEDYRKYIQVSPETSLQNAAQREGA